MSQARSTGGQEWEGAVLSVPEYGAPLIADTAWVAQGAVVVGDVQIGEQTSIWYNAVVRGDSDSVRIGNRSNVQDGVVIHTQQHAPARIGDDVSIGHNAVVHGARIDSGCLIGMSATILSGAHVGEGCLIGAGAVVAEGAVIPAGSLALGVPARVVRPLTDEDREHVRRNAARYLEYSAHHAGATRG